MARQFTIFSFIMQCAMASSLALAGTGHTIRNGGGLGEIEFTGIWQSLDSILAPCLHPRNLCGLSPNQIEILKLALKNRPSAHDVPSQDMYTEDGKPRARSELVALAVANTLKCEGGLVAIHAADLTAQALAFTYFREYEGDRAVALTGKSSLILVTPERTLDLAEALLKKVRVAPGYELQIFSVTSGAIADGLQVDGSAMLDPVTRIHFHMVYGANGVLEVMVFP